MSELLNTSIWQGLLIPFAGTTLGAACVFMKGAEPAGTAQPDRLCCWSYGGCLYLESVNSCYGAISRYGSFAFIPAVAGFWLGILSCCYWIILRPIFICTVRNRRPQMFLLQTMMLVLAVIIHNIPEGMAVGVVYASWQAGVSEISLAAATAFPLALPFRTFLKVPLSPCP